MCAAARCGRTAKLEAGNLCAATSPPDDKASVEAAAALWWSAFMREAPLNTSRRALVTERLLRCPRNRKCRLARDSILCCYGRAEAPAPPQQRRGDAQQSRRRKGLMRNTA